MNNILILDNTTIKTDSGGRYCLNDLHKAAGENKTHQPFNFMRRVETRAMIAEIESSSDVRNYEPVSLVLGKGKNQGTYVCKELVYACAMWISPADH